MAKPKDLSQYKEWARTTLNFDFDDETNATLFELNSKMALPVVQGHPFFSELGQKLHDWNLEYKLKTNSDLLMVHDSPELVGKSYESAVNKTFRINVLWNRNFPKKPDDGWVNAESIFQSINDSLRGTIVCRFIDGPKFLVTKLMDQAKYLGLRHDSRSQERDAGYYAFHFYVWIPITITNKTWNNCAATLPVEIIITTQLQDVLKEMTHRFYEVDRLKSFNSGKWKWEFGTNRFKIGYLSHALHFLESVIVEARDFDRRRQARKKK